ncbi:hypothetical protein PTTG_00322 [Puccinia triticina 1-1 BBBD Race 1]|uniref:Palmitoyltransferase PFA4 n=2 Tax=Puccinia triticina TaxID=208348 RepID=A0A0C4EHV6_PUCT1|nr:uncharacterized protein PtA15_8A401 [Puccinia triticina]OAV98273.1 hypothetical protein PTTG_00322 [Puccinia triticina 1-1 BBBD Race 1]WAQ87497.1 hypothetical protein PtA15_8A401 [Puccinia triticina]WAR57355.1 hypothetical protein PtB15_8B402 [Puccinia triticina]
MSRFTGHTTTTSTPSFLMLDTGRLWIIGTTSLISFIAFSPQIFIIIPLFDHPSTNPDCLGLLVPFNILVGLLFIHYFLCITTDPGRVPKEWDPVGLIESEENGRAKLLSLGQLRFCRACKVSKPPRAHHCRTCKRCVLKMDHHCPWVNNCVGYHNYGHFLRFLGFVDLACWYHIWMISKRVFGEFAYGPEPSKTEMIFLVLNYVACLPVILAVGVFSLYHLWAAVSNTTTIEGWEKEKARELRRKGRIQQFSYPFSIGIYRNLQAVLGRNPLLWWLPQRMSGDGLRYPTDAAIDPLEQYLWPPRDLFTRRAPQLRRRQFEQEAFTYGDERLNPELVPSRTKSVHAGVPRRTVSPYHADYALENDDGEWEEESDSGRLANGHVVDFSGSDDEEPLSTLVARRKHQPTVVARRPLVRRGSEGVEIKSVGPRWSSSSHHPCAEETRPADDGRWLEVEGSEGSDGWD